MASRLSTNWRSIYDRLGGRSSFATATLPKMKAYNPAVGGGYVYEAKPHDRPRPIRGDFVPVYVAVGMIVLSSSLGLYTAWHQLSHSPNVMVKKSRRETVPEVVDPDHTLTEAEKFIKESLFRKVAHIQDHGDPVVPDNIRGEAIARPVRRTETLKTVGVDPKVV